jgi:Fe-S-cluster formation regulator IscX/YfhJ
MDSIDDQKTKFNEKVLEAQAKKGKNSRMLTREHYLSTVERLKQLENPSEARSLTDYNLMRRFALLRVESGGNIVEKLVRPGTNARFVPFEELFDVIHEVDRGRCEFPNVHAVVLEVNEAGMYKLGTKQGLIKGVYSRNQFDPLPERLLLVSDVNQETEVALRSAANKQSQGGGQGFVKCGCIKTCQANNCKCRKNNQYCNSRCHKGSKCCLNHE